MTARREAARCRLGRVPVVAAAVAVAVGLAVCAALISRPAAASSPAASSPAAAPPPAIDAGLAHVNTVRGVLVLDPPYRYAAKYWHMAWTSFAATSGGDRKADVHYEVDWAGARRAYLTALASLRGTKGSLSASQYAQEMKDLKRQSAVVTRTLWVQESARHTSTLVFYSADPVTRRPARAKYIALPGGTGLPPTPDHTDSWRVWELATQLRAAIMADQPGIGITETAVRGRPDYRIAVPANAGAPAWTALVDKTTGLTLALSQDAGAWNGGPGALSPFHVAKLRVNEPLPPGTFSVRPDYRVLRHPAGVPDVATMDLGSDPGQEQWFSPRRLSAVAPASQLVPSWVPPGFELSAVRQLLVKGGPTYVSLIYRRGMSTFTTWSGARQANVDVGSGGVVGSDRIAAFDRTTWPPLGGYLGSVDAIETLAGGALGGAPAATSVAIGAPAEIQAWTARDEAQAGGDLTRDELMGMAGSLEPVEPGAWPRPVAGLLSLIAVVVAALAAAATARAWMRSRRDDASAARPSLSALTWPLVGLALMVAGACLEWHALLHNGPAWGMRGWDEPLGRWAIAAALAAVTCAAWAQLTREGRRRQVAKTGALLLSAAALAGAALALVYLPAVARFTVYPGDASSISDEGWLSRIVSSRFSPSATIGLYVSIVGALLLLVGMLLLRRRAAAEAARTDPTSPSPVDAARLAAGS